MRINPKHIAAGLVMILIIITAFAVFDLGKDEKSDRTVKPPATPSTAPQVARSDDPTLLTEEKASLNTRVAVFTRLYFSFDPRNCGSDDEVKSQIKPYATSDFLIGTDNSACTSEAHKAMLEEKATSSAEAKSSLIGEFVNKNTAQGVVVVQVTKYDRSGKVINSISFNQFMTWVNVRGMWLIDSLN